jgi:hypothetical protein
MTRFEKAAAKAIAACLSQQPVRSLYAVSVIADQAAAQAGKKRDLFSSLYDYTDLLPAGYMALWLANSANPDGCKMLYVVPRNFTQAPSRDLLLGSGTLIPTRSPDD